MLIRFRVGRDARGRFSARKTSLYMLRDWHIDISGDEQITCRPSLRTFGRRLETSLGLFLLLGILLWQYGWPWEHSPPQRRVPVTEESQLAALERDLTRQLQGTLPPERWQQFEETQRQRQQQRQVDRARHETRARRLRAVGAAAYWTTISGLTAMALVPLLLVPVHRVTVALGPDRSLVVCKRGLWKSRRHIRVADIARILVGPEENVTRYRFRRIRHGWHWIVRLVGNVQPNPAGEAAEELDVQFFVGFQKHQPEDPARPPHRVQAFVQRLSQLTGVADIAHAIAGERFGQPGRYGWPLRSQTVTAFSQPETEKHTYRSLDEVPPHLREDIERLVEESRRTGRREIRRVRVTVRDSDGNQVTYNSLEEMPPDVRARYERSLGQSRRRPDSG